MAEKYIELCEARPHIIRLHRVVEGSLQKKFYPSKPQGRISDGFIYILEGKARYGFSDYSFEVSTGEVMLLCHGSMYSINILSDNYKYIFVDFDFGENVKSDIFSMTNVKGIESMFRRMLEKWRLQKPAAREDCMAILYSVYAEVVRAKQAVYIPSSRRRQLDSALQYISENFNNEGLTVESVAETAGMSESHFRRLFKSAYQLSPVKYINLMRVNRAKELIRYSTYSFSQIALETGFANVYYFSRIFKKEVGCTPSEYRAVYSEYQET
ncbi:MAG: helix-turn-helix transcriptional regulator [Clostridia bacterium]|nr:helix-turn-helix transcriptional regulator [Clostridia bacterium]